MLPVPSTAGVAYPSQAVATGSQAMGFCELTGVWSSLLYRQRCVGSWCKKRDSPGGTTASLSPMSLLTVLKGDPIL